MRKIVILLSTMLFMVACEKGNEEVKEAKVVVSVYDENGKMITGVPVKMYNEKDYKIFEKDNLTSPTAIIQTNKSGIATFTLPQEEWFAAQSQRFLTFVVQEGGGPDNYQIFLVLSIMLSFLTNLFFASFTSSVNPVLYIKVSL